jgi:predicted DsbA family dithiol-disulfide isomerase
LVIEKVDADVRIDVWSDVVCPFCYIGKRRLEKALADTGISADIVWHSFQLDPSTKNDDNREHATRLAEKYGRSRDWAVQMLAQVTRMAAEEGLEYHFEKAKAANTADAHRLLHLARELVEAGEVPADTQSRLKERLLRGYFTEGRHVGDHDTLAELATEVGLPAERVHQVLAGTQYAKEVQDDQAQALSYGATGVPFFVIDNKYGIGGAQPLEVFKEALRRANADRQTVTMVSAPTGSGAGSADDPVCGPDGCPI